MSEKLAVSEGLPENPGSFVDFVAGHPEFSRPAEQRLEYGRQLENYAAELALYYGLSRDELHDGFPRAERAEAA